MRYVLVAVGLLILGVSRFRFSTCYYDETGTGTSNSEVLLTVGGLFFLVWLSENGPKAVQDWVEHNPTVAVMALFLVPVLLAVTFGTRCR